MGLELKYTATLSSDGKTLFIYDATGAYNSTTNPTVWCYPNPETSDVTSAILLVTNPSGTQYSIDVSDDLPTTDNTPYELTMAELGGVDTTAFVDGNWSIKYQVVVSGTTTYSQLKWEFIYTATKCCIYKNLAGVNVEKCCCDNPEEARIIKMYVAYRAMLWAAMLGQYTKAKELMDYVNIICSNSTICQNC